MKKDYFQAWTRKSNGKLLVLLAGHKPEYAKKLGPLFRTWNFNKACKYARGV
jgi:hypothetical protein